jgi:hypothetical protein
MFSYAAYGLSIRSSLLLPELTAVEAAPDVTVRLGTVDRPASAVSDAGAAYWAAPDEARLFYDRAAAFRIQGGREVIVEPAPGADEKALRFLLLGQAMSVLLHQRRLLVLHANTVSVHGSAVAFLGCSGQGKSTMTATLYTEGHAVVADDVTAVDLLPDAPTVYPGWPQIKLCPETVVHLGEAPEAWPQLHPWSEKRLRRVERGFSLRPLPLRRLYVLADAPRREIEVLRPQEAFMELVRNTYAAVAQLLRHTGGRSDHFRQCEELARHGLVCRLKRPRCLASLPALARLVEEDVARVAG